MKQFLKNVFVWVCWIGGSTLLISCNNTIQDQNTSEQAVTSKNKIDSPAAKNTLRRGLDLDIPSSGERLALVVANQNYTDSSLNNIRNAIKDVDRIGDLLGGEEGLGYEVKKLVDLGYDDLMEQVSHFVEKVGPESTVVVYYSGHGVALDGENLVVPADFTKSNLGNSSHIIKKSIKSRTLNLKEDILGLIENKNPSGLVAFYDACRNDILSSNTRNLGTTSFVPSKVEGSAIFYSADAGEFATDRLSDDDPVELSLFTRVLVKTLEDDPTIKLRDLHPKLRSGVDRLAASIGEVQKPIMENDLEYIERDSFCLATSKGRCGLNERRRVSEEQYWDFVSTLGSADAFQAYLEKYPQGKHSDKALIAVKGAKINLNNVTAITANVADSNEGLEARCSEGEFQSCSSLGHRLRKGSGIEKDEAKAISLFQKACNGLHYDSCASLGYMHEKGLGVPINYEEMYKWYHLAAENGNVIAMNNLGSVYRAGLGLNQPNNLAALKWYEMASASGNHAAMANQANVMLKLYPDNPSKVSDALTMLKISADAGDPVGLRRYGAQFMGLDTSFLDLDWPQAWHYTKKAAEKGDKSALFNMGWMADSGKLGDEDVPTAIKYYEKAVEKGSANAAHNLGRIYLHGDEGVPKDLEEAFKYIEFSAKRKNRKAGCDLGYMYFAGKGVTKDLQQGIDWLEKSVTDDNEFCMYRIGVAYLFQYDENKNPKNLEIAEKWLRDAAEMSEEEALFDLGVLYIKYLDRPSEALEWFRKGANVGHERSIEVLRGWHDKTADTSYLDSNIQVTTSQSYGTVAPKNTYGDFSEILKAAEAGDDSAQTLAGDIYLKGCGMVEISQETAYFWTKRAAQNGNAMAMLNTGLLESLGIGTKASPEQGLAWYKKSAEAGLAEGQETMGTFYSKGRFVDQSDALAKLWWNKAAQQGHKDAITRLAGNTPGWRMPINGGCPN